MSTIKLRRSGVGGKIPTTAQLDLGEVALNTFDGRLYIKKSVNSVESIVGLYGSPVNEESIYIDSYTGDGSSGQTFNLSYIPKADQYAYVSINGVRQHVSEYSISGNTLSFTGSYNPLSTDEIEIRVHDTITDSVVVRDYQQYVYSGLSSATSVSGADDNSRTLAYDINKVEVYANGVRLVDGSDYLATNGTSIVFQGSQTITGTVEVVSLSRASFADSSALTPIATPLTATTANQVADSFQTASYRTAKYLVQMTAGSDYHSTEILLIHDGTTVYMTEYGTIFTNASLGTFDGDISSGLVRLLVTPANINTTIKIQRLSVTV
jgi:hypothetical protein